MCCQPIQRRTNCIRSSVVDRNVIFKHQRLLGPTFEEAAQGRDMTEIATDLPAAQLTAEEAARLRRVVTRPFGGLVPTPVDRRDMDRVKPRRPQLRAGLRPSCCFVFQVD